MKTILIFIFVSHISFAGPNQCLEIFDDLDRQYCIDKSLRQMDRNHSTLLRKYRKGINSRDKNRLVGNLNKSIFIKKKQIEVMQLELEKMNNQRRDLISLKPRKRASFKKASKKKNIFDKLKKIKLKL